MAGIIKPQAGAPVPSGPVFAGQRLCAVHIRSVADQKDNAGPVSACIPAIGSIQSAVGDA